MSRDTKIHKWLCPGEVSGRFLMLPPDIYENANFQALKPAARDFYIFLNAYRETEPQRACLHEALTEYNRLEDLGLTEFDINEEARPGKHTKYNQGYFVAPLKHLEKHGYKKSYVTKLKKELIEKGFIRIAYGGKGRYCGWNQNATIYQFVNTWQQAKE